MADLVLNYTEQDYKNEYNSAYFDVPEPPDDDNSKKRLFRGFIEKFMKNYTEKKAWFDGGTEWTKIEKMIWVKIL